ncbi:hypothetical protein [Mycobacteroides abscessus]|uniref:hypothetical protein n=1 Tax=Mycobacteroides abscessus TaxID=36809 RepID=UPI0009A55C49|nr:hypothetical protein [Mycobacteroides abscessus]SKH87331.1 Uncharacterised protein [Mycobacteroides abscessus subsp. massiliense]SKH91756.1 Uncharacterised protein [Mycobacteroides abscessus subsp. massiliense]SKI12439.1 Uncharacterised protein [Mycobacteroides abscessus subsp. massiliense]SKK22766.1 Uncharacterised protein [Mycobacteroides abscessus subsp. massiliense]SKK30477.1 Uncharacterised protein [Mycobacteroides abscessus subsp. massiliense]
MSSIDERRRVSVVELDAVETALKALSVALTVATVAYEHPGFPRSDHDELLAGGLFVDWLMADTMHVYGDVESPPEWVPAQFVSVGPALQNRPAAVRFPESLSRQSQGMLAELREPLRAATEVLAPLRSAEAVGLCAAVQRLYGWAGGAARG